MLRRHLASAVLTSALTISLVHGQQDVPQTELLAHNFLLAVYPELRTAAVVISHESVGPLHRVTITESRVSPLLKARVDDRSPLLVAEFAYAESALRSFRASGTLVSIDENLRLRGRLKASEDPAALLAAERGRFGVSAGDSLLTSASLTDLYTALGTITAHSTVLRDVAGDPRSVYGAAWEMSVTARKESAAALPFKLLFEPYTGRLVGVSR